MTYLLLFSPEKNAQSWFTVGFFLLNCIRADEVSDGNPNSLLQFPTKLFNAYLLLIHLLIL